ncbi:response regulator transcription factor [Candidatus Peregrinibacteria bacterium]|nr:response regulator transcription factor [Candidatus Peregrinibacteria bacterium]
MQTFKRILLIDDEPAIAETISAYALKDGMELVHTEDGESGMDQFSKQHFDLILLDWMLPGISGPEFVKSIREKSDVPVLMVSARNDESDIVLGIEMGADDYITKPFGPRELMARIHSLIRRSEKTLVKSSHTQIGDVTISFEQKSALKKGKPMKLTPNEYRILEKLYQNKDFVVSRDELMRTLGYHDFINDRTLDTHIKNLRRKVEKDPKNPVFIQTVRESGFKLCLQ